MFKSQITHITFDNLTLRYPPSVAQFLMEEIAKAQMVGNAANQDPFGATPHHDDAFQAEAVA